MFILTGSQRFHRVGDGFDDPFHEGRLSLENGLTQGVTVRELGNIRGWS